MFGKRQGSLDIYTFLMTGEAIPVSKLKEQQPHTFGHALKENSIETTQLAPINSD